MLNKELLLMNNDREIPKKGYTHVLTVGTDSSSSYGYDRKSSYGSLSPIVLSDVDGTEITALFNTYGVNVVVVYTDGIFGDASHYILGRADTKENLGTASRGNDAFGIASWKISEPFITERDLGKRIPIWLSTEQPPWDSARNQSGGTTDTEK